MAGESSARSSMLATVSLDIPNSQEDLLARSSFLGGDAAGCQVEPLTLNKVALESGGEISASQEALLAGPSFLGQGDNDNGVTASQEGLIAGLRYLGGDQEDVFGTPPETQDAVTTCTLPFTPVTSSTPTDDDGGDSDQEVGNYIIKRRRKPRAGARRVRGSGRSTPTPSASQPQQQPEQPQPQGTAGAPPQQTHVDPLARAVMMIPIASRPSTAAASGQNPLDDFIAIARQRGFL